MKNNRIILIAIILLLNLTIINPSVAKGETIPNSSLQIVSVSPIEGTKNIPANTRITIKFNKNISSGKLYSGITVTSDNTSINFGKAIEGDKLIISPMELYKFGKPLKIILPGSSIADVQGNNLSSNQIELNYTVGQEFTRLSGVDRYETSIKVSQAGWQKADVIVLATGEDFPDALSAGPLAKKYSAPLLLTEPQILRMDIEQEIDRLEPKTIFIIGGNGVISQNIEDKLRSKNITVERIGGNDRYETSLKIADHVGITNDMRNIFLVTGDSFADALSISSYASANSMPIILTQKDKFPDGLIDFVYKYLPKLNPYIYIIGGTGVISQSLQDSLPFGNKRIGGADRYDTNYQILMNFNHNYTNVFFTTGENFPDALSGCALSSIGQSPIILLDESMGPKWIDTWKLNKIMFVMKYILGGEGAVKPKVIDSIFK